MSIVTSMASALLVVYIVLESISAIASMRAGYSCIWHKLKYLAAITAAVVVGYKAWHHILGLEHLVLLGALALFILPRSLHRLGYRYERNYAS
ncbi:hypothetical protein ACW4YW_14970 [Methylobacillus pratensis]